MQNAMNLVQIGGPILRKPKPHAKNVSNQYFCIFSYYTVIDGCPFLSEGNVLSYSTSWWECTQVRNPFENIRAKNTMYTAGRHRSETQNRVHVMTPFGNQKKQSSQTKSDPTQQNQTQPSPTPPNPTKPTPQKTDPKLRPFSGQENGTTSVKVDSAPSNRWSQFLAHQVGAFLGPPLLATLQYFYM